MASFNSVLVSLSFSSIKRHDIETFSISTSQFVAAVFTKLKIQKIFGQRLAKRQNDSLKVYKTVTDSKEQFVFVAN